MKVIDTVKEFSFIELLIFFMIAICVVALVLSLTTETITKQTTLKTSLIRGTLPLAFIQIKRHDSSKDNSNKL